MDQREDLHNNGMLHRLTQQKMERNTPAPSGPLSRFISRQQGAESLVAAEQLDGLAVSNFAAAMKMRLAASRAKGWGGWLQCPVEHLQEMLIEYLTKGDPVDVANVAMMLWNRGSITSIPIYHPCEQCAGTGDGGPSEAHEQPCKVCNGLGKELLADTIRRNLGIQPYKQSGVAKNVSWDDALELAATVCEINKPGSSPKLLAEKIRSFRTDGQNSPRAR